MKPSVGVFGGLFLLVCSSLLGQEVVDLPSEDRSLRVNFTEVFRVGTLEGDEWETFGSVGGVGFDARGNLHVFDAMNARVVVIDTDGKLVRMVGRHGDGPGEFRNAAGFAVLRDGTIVVVDLGHRAFSLFSPDGSYERSVSFQPSGHISIGRTVPDLSRDGLLTGGGEGMAVFQEDQGDGPGPPPARPITRISLRGPVEHRTILAEGWQPPRAERVGGGRGASMGGHLVFEPKLLFGALPGGGLAYTDSSAYTVRILDPGGVSRRNIRRPFGPRLVTDDVREREIQRRMEAMEAGDGPQAQIILGDGEGGATRTLDRETTRSMLEAAIPGLQFFPEIPVIRNLATGWGGLIWVERSGEDPSQGGVIDLLDSSGHYVGSFAEGATSFPVAFGPEGLTAFLEPDEMGVPVIEVRRLPEPIW